MVTVPFNGVDNVMRALDEPRRPETIELEIAVRGRLDEKRLREAVMAAAARHPMARARQLPAKPFDLNYTWTITDHFEVDPVEVSTASRADEVGRIRDVFISRHIEVSQGPPFRLLLLHGRDHDRVILSVSHVALDGVASLRLLQSISRAYTGEDDPLPDVDPLAVRDLLDEPSRRARATRGALLMLPRQPARLAHDPPAEPAAGFGVLHIDCDLAELPASGVATVNDVLIAALHWTIDRPCRRARVRPCRAHAAAGAATQRAYARSAHVLLRR